MSWKIPVCDGCKRDNPIGVMVKDEIWSVIRPLVGGPVALGGLLCPNCMESKLGRKLTRDDLKQRGCNEQIFLGMAMLEKEFGNLPGTTEDVL